MSNGKVVIIKNIHIIYSFVLPKLNASSRANCWGLVNVKIGNIHIMGNIHIIGNIDILDNIYQTNKMGGIGKLHASRPPFGGNRFM